MTLVDKLIYMDACEPVVEAVQLCSWGTVHEAWTAVECAVAADETRILEGRVPELAGWYIRPWDLWWFAAAIQPVVASPRAEQVEALWRTIDWLYTSLNSQQGVLWDLCTDEVFRCCRDVVTSRALSEELRDEVVDHVLNEGLDATAWHHLLIMVLAAFDDYRFTFAVGAYDVVQRSCQAAWRRGTNYAALVYWARECLRFLGTPEEASRLLDAAIQQEPRYRLYSFWPSLDRRPTPGDIEMPQP